jgi:RNA polymerase sigma-70 factor (ECF subfamily)
VLAPRGKLVRVVTFAFANDKVTLVEAIADPDRLRELDLAVL